MCCHAKESRKTAKSLYHLHLLVAVFIGKHFRKLSFLDVEKLQFSDGEKELKRVLGIAGKNAKGGYNLQPVSLASQRLQIRGDS